MSSRTRDARKSAAPAARTPDASFDFVAIVDRYETPLLRYAGQLLGPDRDAAEEAVQEAFLRLHRQVRRHGIASIENLAGWLFRVAHNLAVTSLRKQKLDKNLREQAAAGALGDVAGGPEPMDALDALVRKEMCDRALAELQTLPEQHRQVILLRIIQGFSFREIGKIMGLSVSHVSYRLNQALREMSRRLKNAGLT